MSSLQGWGWLVTKYGSLVIGNTHSSHLAQCSNTSALLKHPVHFQQASPWARSAGAWGWMLGLWLRTGNWKHPQFWKGGVGMQGKGQWGSFLERDELCEYTPSKKKKKCSLHTHTRRFTLNFRGWLFFPKTRLKILTTDTNLFNLCNYMADLPYPIWKTERKKKWKET